MKRVYCLYRVSTLGQVEKDDIPMQRQACHTFAREKGWQIIKEFSEKGVSGFKKSADRREAMRTLKEATVLKRFDILLVFMFDRLGRRDDETPFVVEWFVKNGIAVWSVMEGEQRFENHVDKLLNYIRFWQSSGESIKTALRTRVRMEQLIQENGYVGGVAPYGYRLCKLGRMNKRGYEVNDILIDPAEADVVRKIFRLYCHSDMGPYQIAAFLTQDGTLTRKGQRWNAASIRNILKNILYTGVRNYGSIQTVRFSHLQIVDDDAFALARQKLLASRLEEPYQPRSKHWTSVLLQDKPYCMHCGKPMTVTLNRKTRRRKDGTVASYVRLKYICINKNEQKPCAGQRSYLTSTIDGLILDALSNALFSNTFQIPPIDEQGLTFQRTQIANSLRQTEGNMESLKAEVIAVLRGTSAFSASLLNELIEQTEIEIASLKLQLEESDKHLHRQKIRWNRLNETRKNFLSSGIRDLSSLTFEQQKDIAALLIDRVEIGRGNAIHIQWSFGGTARLGVGV